MSKTTILKEGDRVARYGSSHIGTVIFSYEDKAQIARVEWDNYYPKRGRIGGQDSQDRTEFVTYSAVEKVSWRDELQAFYSLRRDGIECPEPPHR